MNFAVGLTVSLTIGSILIVLVVYVIALAHGADGGIRCIFSSIAAVIVGFFSIIYYHSEVEHNRKVRYQSWVINNGRYATILAVDNGKVLLSGGLRVNLPIGSTIVKNDKVEISFDSKGIIQLETLSSGSD